MALTHWRCDSVRHHTVEWPYSCRTHQSRSVFCRASWRREVEQKGSMADVSNAECRIAYCRLGYFLKSRHSYNVSAYI